MAHGMIVGQTESGKTILAKTLSCDLIKKGFSVLVLDPIGDPEWLTIVEAPRHNDQGAYGFVTSDPWAFDRMVWSSRHCILMIDESGEHAGHYDKQFFPWATRSRHLGHSAYFIAQRAQLISPTVRGQCRYLFMFNSSFSDADILSKEFNQPELTGALPQFHYFYACRFETLRRGVVKPVDNWRQYRDGISIA